MPVNLVGARKCPGDHLRQVPEESLESADFPLQPWARMLKPVLDIGVPALVILTMVAVGLGLTVGDFRRVVSMPGLVAAATVGQLVFLPLVALVLVRSLGLSPSVEKGMLLIAACPAGSMANLYAHLAKANVALSVSLTAVSCLSAVVTMPALMMGFRAYLGETAGL